MKNFQDTNYYKFVTENKEKIAAEMFTAHSVGGQYACIAPREGLTVTVTRHSVGHDTCPHSIGFGAKSSTAAASRHIDYILSREDWSDADHFDRIA